IKPSMLKEATKNARLAANEFAANAGVQVGGIRDARQGGFIVRDVGEDYSDTAKIDKDVRVVTTITFYLTD
ncbi:MAG: SIMPL domain-containing protein, partial [Pseudomonadota bacterium]